VKVMPVIEMRPVIGVTVSVAQATAAEHRRGAKAAAMKAAASESAAVKRSTAAPETTAMKTTTMESAATESAATAAKSTASATAESTTAAAMPDFGRHITGCKFCRRRRAGTRQRERLGALL
jgi:hypothetical protein